MVDVVHRALDSRRAHVAELFEHPGAELVAVDAAAPANVHDMADVVGEPRIRQTNVTARDDVDVRIVLQGRLEVADIIAARRQHVAPARHAEDIVGVVCKPVELFDAVVGKRRHHRVRPPVAVVVARLRTRVAHRLARVDQYDRAFAMACGEVPGRCDARDAGTDDCNLVPAGLRQTQSFLALKYASSVMREFSLALSRNSK